MSDYKAIAASLRACNDPQKRYAADVIDGLADALSVAVREARSGKARESILQERIEADAVYVRERDAYAENLAQALRAVRKTAIYDHTPEAALIDAALQRNEIGGGPRCATCHDTGEVEVDHYESEPCPDCPVPATGGSLIDRQIASRAAEDANRTFGQWMPDAWLRLFEDAYDAWARTDAKCSACNGSGTVYDTTRGPDGGPEVCPLCFGEGDAQSPRPAQNTGRVERVGIVISREGARVLDFTPLIDGLAALPQTEQTTALWVLAMDMAEGKQRNEEGRS
jgi:truncated hemoglobin YjbI